MSYGIDIPAIGHGIADIVGHILKGAKPSNIPSDNRPNSNW